MTQVVWFGSSNMEKAWFYFEGEMRETAERAAETLRAAGAKGPFSVCVYNRSNVNTCRDAADLDVVIP